MWGLLEWLYNYASRVYEILGTLYSRVRDAALNAYNWARDKAAQALASARDYAWSLYGLARAFVLDKWEDAKAFARSLRQLAEDTAWGWIEWLKGVVRGWVNSAESLSHSLTKAAKDAASAWDSVVLGRAFDRTEIKHLEGKEFTKLGDKVGKDYTDAETGKVIKQLQRSGLEKEAAQFTLAAFLANPVGTLLAWLLSVLLDYLFDVLASALGSVKYNLGPPLPIPGGGSGGPLPGPIPLPPSPGELIRPCTPLYISGYTFSAGHPGTDFGIGFGQTIYAAHDGEVDVASWSVVGYGLNIVISGSPWWSRYAHLTQALVGKGDRVLKGQPIAQGDTTGNSSGNHLHFEIKRGGVFVDPMSVLP